MPYFITDTRTGETVAENLPFLQAVARNKELNDAEGTADRPDGPASAQSARFEVQPHPEPKDLSHLAKIGQYPGAAAVAKNIRAHLKKHFPAVKFSVRCSDSGAINIRYTDGPTSRSVENKTVIFTAGHFDGMTDCYEYARTDFNKVYGSTKYIFIYRAYSAAAITAQIDALCLEYGHPGPNPTADDLNNGRTHRLYLPGTFRPFDELFHRFIQDKTL